MRFWLSLLCVLGAAGCSRCDDGAQKQEEAQKLVERPMGPLSEDASVVHIQPASRTAPGIPPQYSKPIERQRMKDFRDH